MPHVTVEVAFYATDAGFNLAGVPRKITSRFEFVVSGNPASRKAQIVAQLAELGRDDAETISYVSGLVDGRLAAEVA